MAYLGEGSDFRQQNKPKPRKVGFSDVGNRGSYTPGGDSYKNYSQADQKKMFKAAGGEKKFKENVADIEQKYKRSADTQRFLDKTNLYNQGIAAGGKLIDGRLQMGKNILRDAKGNQILSMYSPYMTAQAPTLSELIGDIGRGAGNMLEAVATQAMSGGIPGKILNYVKDKYEELTSPNTVSNVPRDSFSSGADATGGAFVGPTFNNQKIGIEELAPIQYSENPLFKEQNFEPIKISDMDTSGLRADNLGLPSLIDLYNFSQNPQINTNMGNFRLDNVFTGDPRIGYDNTVMINGVPVNLNANIGQDGGIGFGANLNFKDGGTVDKYSGLGYKLR